MREGGSRAAAYVLVAHDMGPHRIAARVDAFETTDTSSPNPDNNNEDGWAVTGAHRVVVNPNMTLAFEGLHVESDRPAREGVGLSSEQAQTTLQSALQLSF